MNTKTKAGPGGPANATAYKAPRPLKKPPLAVGVGFWVDPDFLPRDLRDSLTDLMPDKDPARVAAFFDDLSSSLQGYQLIGATAPADVERAHILRVAEQAAALLQSINRMQAECPQAVQSFEAHSAALAFLSRPPADLPESVREALRQAGGQGLLSIGWEWVAGLRLAADYAAWNIKPSRQVKVSVGQAKTLCNCAVNAYVRAYGETPPAGQHGWFATFMAELGASFGVTCGARVVREVVNANRTAP